MYAHEVTDADLRLPRGRPTNQQFIEIATIKVLDGGERLSDAAKVSRFVKAMTGGVLMPPIVVLEGATIPLREAAEISRYMTEGATDLSEKRFLVDGQHRLLLL